MLLKLKLATYGFVSSYDIEDPRPTNYIQDDVDDELEVEEELVNDKSIEKDTPDNDRDLIDNDEEARYHDDFFN